MKHQYSITVIPITDTIIIDDMGEVEPLDNFNTYCKDEICFNSYGNIVIRVIASARSSALFRASQMVEDFYKGIIQITRRMLLNEAKLYIRKELGKEYG